MPGRQTIDGSGDPGGSQQTIALIVKMIDRLEVSIDRLQTTVREDFASQAELELLKLAFQQLRTDVDRKISDINAASTTMSDSDRKIARWFIRVAIPMGFLALVKFAWDALMPWLRAGGGSKP